MLRVEGDGEESCGWVRAVSTEVGSPFLVYTMARLEAARRALVEKPGAPRRARQEKASLDDNDISRSR